MSCISAVEIFCLIYPSLLNGAEAASVLKQTMPRVPIILFTMYDFGETIAAAVGVDVVLSKPDGVHQLTAHLKRLLSPVSALRY
jgi:DNA-binding NarL/FixJ family response regulator